VLLHSSGIFRNGVALDYSTREKFIQSMKDSGMESKPGAAYRYSNAGYTLLASIIEIVSHQRFEDFIYNNIFHPLKMNNTGFPWEQRLDKRVFATGYNSKKVPEPPEPDVFGARGPGNLLTTTDDLYKWVKAINNKNFMRDDFRKILFTDFIPGKETYSWNKSKTSRNTNFYHKGGGRPDFESQMMWYPEDDVLIIFLINNDYNLRSRLFHKVRSMMN
jgi:CubicO group peptidase (beta-lactamase class C family)